MNTRSKIHIDSLSDQMRNCLEQQMNLSNLERADLLQQVVGEGGDAAGDLYGGFTTALGIRAALQSCGRDITRFHNVLDFGCGSGRVIRWFGDIVDRTDLIGVDISSDAIDWCSQNIPFANFHIGPSLPPLNFPEKSFDLIYGISVFTHLNQEFESAWIGELGRLICPGGLLLLSFHGDDKALRVLSADEYRKFKRRGFLYKPGRGASVDGLPDFYQVAFHSDRYVRSKWGKGFRVLGQFEHGPMYEQKLVILERSNFFRPILPFRKYIEKLPLSCLDSPTVGSKVTDSFVVEGWRICDDSSNESPYVWVDGRKMGSCSTASRRSDVSEVFGVPDHHALGFRGEFSTKEISDGMHVLWITAQHSYVPLAASWFST